MPNIADLYTSVRADMSQFDSDLAKGLERSGQRAGQTWGQRFRKQLTASNIGAGIGAALGGIGVAALKLGDDYDKAMDAIRIGTGATGDELKGLEDDFKAVAARVPDDIGTISQVIADLNTRTGLTGEGLQALAEQILDLSRITGGDAAANVASLTRLFGDWSIASEDQSAALDKVFRASQNTGIGIDQLAQQMVQFGAPLRNIGYEFEDGLALLAKWEKEGVNTTLALGGLKIALGEFAKEGKDAKTGLADLVDQIVNADTAAQAMAIGVGKFGSRAGPDMVAAIREGRFAFDDLTDIISNGSETIASATEDTEGLGEAWRQFKNIVATTVGPITKDLGGIANEMGNLVYLLPAIGGVLGKGIVLFAQTLKRSLGGPVIKAAMAAAGAAMGVVYRTAMFVGEKFVTAAVSLMTMLGGGRVVAAATAAGAKVGAAYAGAAGASGLLGAAAGVLAAAAPLAIPVAVVAVAHEPIMDALGAPSVGDLAAVGHRRAQEKQLKELEDERLDIANQLIARYGEQSEEMTALQARYDELNDRIDMANGRTEELVKQRDGIADLAPPTLAVAAAMLKEADAADDAATSTGTLRANLKALNKDIESFSDVRPLSKVNKEIDRQRTLMEKAAKEGNYAAWARHKASLTALRDEREQSRTAQKALGEWQEKSTAIDRLSQRFDVNKRTVREVMKENQGNIQATKTALEKLRKKADDVDATDPSIDVDADTSQATSKIEALRAKLVALTSSDVYINFRRSEFGGDRASGGPVSANTPYIVGERGPEVFTPSVSGHITSNDRIGGDTYNIEPRIYGAPQRASTPREVVAEIRRASRDGFVRTARRTAWEPV